MENFKIKMCVMERENIAGIVAKNGREMRVPKFKIEKGLSPKEKEKLLIEEANRQKNKKGDL